MSSTSDHDEFSFKIAKEKEKNGTVALDPYFYKSSLVYQKEIEHILFRSWIYAAHISEIPNKGDYVLFKMGVDSIIVVRDREGEIRAHANTCRHRGARLCDQDKGRVSTLVCPYHAWTYNLDGTLRSARFMEAYKGFDKADYSLKSVRVTVYMGLIFINCDPEAEDFSAPLAAIKEPLGAYDLENAKIARKTTYKIDANWKFCLENYLECYHCGPAHKDYAKMHTLQDTYENVAGEVEAMLERAPAKTGVAGISSEYQKIYATAEGFGACVYHSRYGLYEGYLTGSEDGKPVAPLMGAFQGYDGGVGDFQMGPVSFMLNYPDHCVLYRFIPRAIDETDAEVVWFVKGDAEEGKDYDADRVTWLWHHTTLEDKYIITQNKEGALSHFFQPGPIQPEFEETLSLFLVWYVDALQGHHSTAQHDGLAHAS
ncbi:MAG: aromatic ring-hydroxylating dioxygenase subunit alpha [Pseudomonadota bacterium]